MRNPARIDLVGDRGVSLFDTITYLGADFTAATFVAQVRLTPDSPGSPLLTPGVTLLYGGTATVAAHVAAQRLSGVGSGSIFNQVNPLTGANFAAGDSVTLSIIQVAVDNSLMKVPGVPAPAQVGDDVVLAWDMLITPSGASADKYFAGDFRVRGTVVQ